MFKHHFALNMVKVKNFCVGRVLVLIACHQRNRKEMKTTKKSGF